jgi:hypothetical protein
VIEYLSVPSPPITPGKALYNLGFFTQVGRSWNSTHCSVTHLNGAGDFALYWNRYEELSSRSRSFNLSLALAFGFMLVAPSCGEAQSRNGLIGYWNLAEGSGSVAHDTSGSGYDGTVNGAAWTTGTSSFALRFNGTTDDVITPNIALGNGFSISAWANSGVLSQAPWSRIAETQWDGGFYLGTDETGGKYKFIVNSGSGFTGSCGARLGCAEGGAVTSGWHLVTGTYDGSTATLYVDGAMAASDTFAAPGNTTYPLYIGRYYADNGSGWNGAIDEVHLYNRAVTSAEVSALYGYIPPTISITAPTTSTVSGAVTVSATAGNNVAVADVQFQLDGANLGPDLTTAPYSFSWDTTTTSDGTHTLTAVARDTSGNTATSAAVVVTVSNSVPPTHYRRVSIDLRHSRVEFTEFCCLGVC